MNLLDSFKDMMDFERPSSRDLAMREFQSNRRLSVENSFDDYSETSRSEREARIARSQFGPPLDGEEVDGLTIDKEQRVKRVTGQKGTGVITRSHALRYSVYRRAVELSSEAAATLMCEATPENDSKKNTYETWKKRGFTGRHNIYNFWVSVFKELQIEGVFYGQITGGSPKEYMIIPHPREVVIPGVVDDELFFNVNLFRRGTIVDQEIVLYDDMLQIMRPNVNEHYIFTDTGPVYSSVLRPVPSYEALSHLIVTGLVIDLLERGFWQSDGTLKFGHVITSEQGTDLDPMEALQDLVTANRTQVPFRIDGTGIKLERLDAFENYDTSLKMIKDDIETRIATYFGLNSTDLGSDAAKKGTAVEVLTDHSWRSGILPLYNSAKYEVSQKLLDGTPLNVPSMRYFMSTSTAPKLAQSLAGLATRNEVRRNLFDMPPLSEEQGGDDLYLGAQEPGTGMSADTESNNEMGENEMM